MGKILNCNSINGNIITENSAKICFYGEINTIHNIYNTARRDANGNIAQQDNFDHLQIKNVLLPKSYSAAFYEALWWQFFHENEKLIDMIRNYDEYDDGLDNNVMNSTARVFRLLKKYGMNGLSSNCKPFFTELKNKIKEAPVEEEETFESLDFIARRYVKEYFGKAKREDIANELKKLNKKGISTLIQLMNIRYDECENSCSKDYIRNELRRIKVDYEKEKNPKLENNNEIILT